MANKDLLCATIKMREFIVKLILECEKRGIPIAVTSVARSIYEQAALYAQGRRSLENVNDLRKIAGLATISEADNNICTKTMKSKHLVNRDNADSDDDFSHAVDIAVVKDGKETWNLKADVNSNNITDYEEVGKIAKEIDPTITWGGEWAWRDMCHFESVA